jgi:hypothetical protein
LADVEASVPHPTGTEGEHIVPGAAGSLGSVLSGLVAAISGIAPHVLHHVGPLAGTALLAGTGGTVLFGVVGFALSMPMLLRLRRRFGTWLAPVVAGVIFLVVYLFSSMVVGPAITGSSATQPGPAPAATPLPSGHDDHHP